MESAPLAELVGRLQDRCLELGLKVATAESCTGGLIAKLITDLPGSSEYFPGGVVSYSDAVKTGLLDVSTDLLAAHGAVSAQVARAMAVGALARFGADLAVAVTGVAGPGGGSAAKPVGLTYVAVADVRGADVRRLLWSGDRAANREASARAAIEMLLGRVEETAAAAALVTGEVPSAQDGPGASGGTPGTAEASRP